MARIRPDEAEHYQSNLSGEWFQLKNDGDVARVQFMFDSYEGVDTFALHRVKVDDKERYVDCLRTYDEPIDRCPFCAAGIPVKPVRFVLMYQHEDGKVKIWERGPKMIEKIKSLCNRYHPLSHKVFEIERSGAAGDKNTRYEIYPMDGVESVDLSDIEKPELLGGLILDKTFDEMETYLDTGSFPSEDGSPKPTAAPARRAPVGRSEEPPARGRQTSRTERPAPQQTPPQTSRGRRGATSDEVF